jgi:hypothetical protein
LNGKQAENGEQENGALQISCRQIHRLIQISEDYLAGLRKL